MQVYDQLQILSARPSHKEMEGIPHHMYGHIQGAVRYSVGMWVRDVVPIILDCLARNRTPILVGGTGLYFKALTDGLAKVPEPSQLGLERAQGLLDVGIDNLRAEAERLDPTAAGRVLGNDPQRLFRIVSVASGTQKPLSEWQKQTKPVIPSGYWRGLLILPDRQYLYDRINARYEAMVESGGLEEAKRVSELGLPTNVPMMKAIGLPPLLKYLRGEISYDAAIFEAKRDTRRFAKRQFTWFRGQIRGWSCANEDTFDEEIGKILRK